MRLSVGAVAVVLALSQTAAAAPLSTALSVERDPGAEDCPDQASLEVMVGRMLKGPGAALSGASGGEIRAQIHFMRTGAGYQASLRLKGAKLGERTLTDTGPTCAAIGRAVGITLVLLFDPLQEDPPEPAPRPDARPVSSPPAAVVIAPVAPVAPPSATAGFLTITAGPAVGLVGAPSAAVGLELDLRLGRRLWLTPAVEYVAARETPFDSGSVAVALWAGRLRACEALTRVEAGVVVAACVEGAAGRLRGEGSGYPSSNRAAMAWFGAGGGVQANAVLAGRWLFGAGADLVAPLHSYTFSVENRGAAYRSSALAAMLQLSVGVKIW